MERSELLKAFSNLTVEQRADVLSAIVGALEQKRVPSKKIRTDEGDLGLADVMFNRDMIYVVTQVLLCSKK